MTLFRRDALEDYEPLRYDSRIFDRYSNMFGLWDFHPALDVVENDHDYVIRLEIPGVDPDHVDITISDRQVIMKGFMEEKDHDSCRGYLRSERRVGKFERQVSLPADIIADKAKASFKDGLLTIAMPKSSPGHGAQIKLNIERAH